MSLCEHQEYQRGCEACQLVHDHSILVEASKQHGWSGPNPVDCTCEDINAYGVKCRNSYPKIGPIRWCMGCLTAYVLEKMK